MQRFESDKQSAVWLSAAAIAALVFVFPEKSRAALFPDKVIFQTEDFVQVIDDGELAQWFTTENLHRFDPTGVHEIENPRYCPFSPITCEEFLPRRVSRHLVISRTPVLDEERVKGSLTALSAQVNTDPKNARFNQQEGTIGVDQEAVPGRELLINETLASLKNRLEQDNTNKSVIVPISTKSIPAKISSATLSNLGVKEVVSVGETDFSGSPRNRIYNIKRAIEQFDGVAIAPGEEFSFVKYLGEVDGEHGYLPELVIKNNQTTPEFGGGICQVSTTVFRAALNAGLSITERKAHAYAVQYYRPYGMDATIYIPKPDLRFVNNTPGYIIMFPQIEGMKLRFTFYGTKDGRSVTFDGPHILSRGSDGSMQTVFTRIVKDINGKEFINEKFWSNYKSPSLFPHPTSEQQTYTSKPAGWSQKQWDRYKSIH